jgi:hypothetical protein
MNKKNLLIGAGVVVLGLLALNYYNKRKSVSMPMIKDDELATPTSGLKSVASSKTLGQGEII